MRSFARWAVLSGLMLGSSVVQATCDTWVGGASGDWDVASNWSPSGVPVALDDVCLGTPGATVTYVNPGNNPTLASLTIDASGAGATLDQGQDSLTAYDEFSGYTGTGSFIQTGGTNTMLDQLFLGWGSGSSGTYALSGSGALVAPVELVGDSGTGTFTQSGGTNKVTSVYVGNNGHGSYTLSAGSLSAGTEIVGYASAGTFTQSGGANTASGTLYLGDSSGASGSYTLMGGTLTVAGISTATGATGNLTIDGGTLNVGGGNGAIDVSTFTVGDTGGSGSYTLGGTGTLAANWEYVASSGNGTVTQTGGTNTVTYALYLGLNSATSGNYSLSGGSVSAGGEYIGYDGAGTFVQTGGTNTVNGPVYLGYNSNYYSTSNGSYTLRGGTLNAGSIYGVGSAATFTIDGGTLNLSTGVGYGTFDVGTLTIGDSQGAGQYTLSGTGQISTSYGVTVNTNGAFTQTGGYVYGHVNNYGSFDYTGGTFDGTLTNNGNFYFTNFVAGGAVVNNAHIAAYSGESLYGGYGGLTNNGTITVLGDVTLGTKNSSAFVNNGTMLVGFMGAGGNPNPGMLTVDAASGNDVNFGNINLASGSELLLASGTTLSNGGTLALNGGIISGSGALNNGVGGTVSGPGSILGSFTNSAGVVLAENGTLNVANGFANDGVVELSGLGAGLTGGSITNGGTLQGAGSVGNAIDNTGTIEALGGTLDLGGAVTNGSSGLMTASSGSTILVSGGLTTNAGVINLTGGVFDNNNHALSNTGQISGYGTIRTGGLTNNGAMTLSGGTTTVNGDVTNASGHTLTVAYNPAIFTGNVTNYGTFKTTSTTVTFSGTYTENGVFHSDPSNNYFTSLAIGQNGYLVGGAGDNWFVSGNFLNNSLQNASWSTGAASLSLDGTGTQQFLLAGANFGASRTGYTNNFAFGTFALASGESIDVGDGNSTPGAALYVGVFDLGGGLSQLSNIHSNYNIYYDPTLAGNAYLGGKTYALNGSGYLVAVSSVPLPSNAWLLSTGLILVTGIARRRRRWPRAG